MPREMGRIRIIRIKLRIRKRRRRIESTDRISLMSGTYMMSELDRSWWVRRHPSLG